MERKLASIQKILEVKTHPNADKLDLAKCLGWQVCVKRGEFKPGDYCVYMEVDSLVPITEWSKFLEDKNKLGQPARIRSVRLRGELSQGICFPTSILPACCFPLEEGSDVTSNLNILKWEMEIPANMGGKIKAAFPSILPKTDEVRLQSFPTLLDEIRGQEVYGTLKIDGSSGTFYNLAGDFNVCSRNLNLHEDEANIFWRLARQLDLKNRIPEGYCVQGEAAGPGINKNRAKLPALDLFAFNVIQIEGRKYLNYEDMLAFCQTHGLRTVPLYYRGPFNFVSVQEIVDSVLEIKYDTGELAEGVVWRPAVEMYSPTLQGRLSFKTINNNYLLKHNL